MMSKGTSNVEFGIIRPIENTSNIVGNNQETTKADITDILSVVVPALQQYTNQNDDEYADLCDEWLQQGLTTTSTFDEVKQICNITSTDDFYMLLKVSVALQHNYEITRNEGNITVSRIQAEEHYEKENAAGTVNDELYLTAVLCNSDWECLHNQVYGIVTQWANTQKLNHLAMAWRTAIKEGLKAESKWDEAKKLLLATTYVEYSCYLTACT
jgi:hypothetical protein